MLLQMAFYAEDCEVGIVPQFSLPENQNAMLQCISVRSPVTHPISRCLAPPRLPPSPARGAETGALLMVDRRHHNEGSKFQPKEDHVREHVSKQ